MDTKQELAAPKLGGIGHALRSTFHDLLFANNEQQGASGAEEDSDRAQVQRIDERKHARVSSMAALESDVAHSAAAVREFDAAHAAALRSQGMLLGYELPLARSPHRPLRASSLPPDIRGGVVYPADLLGAVERDAAIRSGNLHLGAPAPDFAHSEGEPAFLAGTAAGAARVEATAARAVVTIGGFGPAFHATGRPGVVEIPIVSGATGRGTRSTRPTVLNAASVAGASARLRAKARAIAAVGVVKGYVAAAPEEIDFDAELERSAALAQAEEEAAAEGKEERGRTSTPSDGIAGVRGEGLAGATARSARLAFARAHVGEGKSGALSAEEVALLGAAQDRLARPQAYLRAVRRRHEVDSHGLGRTLDASTLLTAGAGRRRVGTVEGGKEGTPSPPSPPPSAGAARAASLPPPAKLPSAGPLRAAQTVRPPRPGFSSVATAGPFIVSPATVDFNGYASAAGTGAVLTRTLTVRNVDSVLRHLRLLPPSSSVFGLSLPSFPGAGGAGGLTAGAGTAGLLLPSAPAGCAVAPGCAVTLTVSFCPPAAAPFEDSLTLVTEGGQFTVPLRATLPPPALDLPLSLPLPVCLPHDLVRLSVVVTNTGSPASFRFLPSPLFAAVAGGEVVLGPEGAAVGECGLKGETLWAGPFTLWPASFTLGQGEGLTLTLQFKPHVPGAATAPLVLLSSDGAVHDHTLTALCVPLDVRVSSLQGTGLAGVEGRSDGMWRGEPIDAAKVRPSPRPAPGPGPGEALLAALAAALGGAVMGAPLSAHTGANGLHPPVEPLPALRFDATAPCMASSKRFTVRSDSALPLPFSWEVLPEGSGPPAVPPPPGGEGSGGGASRGVLYADPLAPPPPPPPPYLPFTITPSSGILPGLGSESEFEVTFAPPPARSEGDGSAPPPALPCWHATAYLSVHDVPSDPARLREVKDVKGLPGGLDRPPSAQAASSPPASDGMLRDVAAGLRAASAEVGREGEGDGSGFTLSGPRGPFPVGAYDAVDLVHTSGGGGVEGVVTRTSVRVARLLLGGAGATAAASLGPPLLAVPGPSLPSQPSTAHAQLHNSGGGPLAFEVGGAGGEGWSVTPPSGTLPPGSSAQLAVVYAGGRVGTAGASLPIALAYGTEGSGGTAALSLALPLRAATRTPRVVWGAARIDAGVLPADTALPAPGIPVSIVSVEEAGTWSGAWEVELERAGEKGGAEVSVTPSRGSTPGGGSSTVHVRIAGGAGSQDLDCVLRLTPLPRGGGAPPSYLRVRARVRSPRVVLSPSSLSLGTLFVGVPIQARLTLSNESDLPAPWTLDPYVGALPPLEEGAPGWVGVAKARNSPRAGGGGSPRLLPSLLAVERTGGERDLKGVLPPRGRLTLTLSVTPRAPGVVDGVLGVDVTGMAAPLGCTLSGGVRGLTIALAVVEEGSGEGWTGGEGSRPSSPIHPPALVEGEEGVSPDDPSASLAAVLALSRSLGAAHALPDFVFGSAASPLPTAARASFTVHLINTSGVGAAWEAGVGEYGQVDEGTDWPARWDSVLAITAADDAGAARAAGARGLPPPPPPVRAHVGRIGGGGGPLVPRPLSYGLQPPLVTRAPGSALPHAFLFPVSPHSAVTNEGRRAEGGSVAVALAAGATGASARASRRSSRSRSHTRASMSGVPATRPAVLLSSAHEVTDRFASAGGREATAAAEAARLASAALSGGRGLGITVYPASGVLPPWGHVAIQVAAVGDMPGSYESVLKMRVGAITRTASVRAVVSGSPLSFGPVRGLALGGAAGATGPTLTWGDEVACSPPSSRSCIVVNSCPRDCWLGLHAGTDTAPGSEGSPSPPLAFSLSLPEGEGPLLRVPAYGRAAFTLTAQPRAWGEEDEAASGGWAAAGWGGWLRARVQGHAVYARAGESPSEAEVASVSRPGPEREEEEGVPTPLLHRCALSLHLALRPITPRLVLEGGGEGGGVKFNVHAADVEAAAAAAGAGWVGGVGSGTAAARAARGGPPPSPPPSCLRSVPLTNASGTDLAFMTGVEGPFEVVGAATSAPPHPITRLGMLGGGGGGVLLPPAQRVFSLPPGATLTLTLAFRPPPPSLSSTALFFGSTVAASSLAATARLSRERLAGEHAGCLTLAFTAGGTQALPLRALVGRAALVANPSGLAFPTTRVGDAAAASLTLTNPTPVLATWSLQHVPSSPRPHAPAALPLDTAGLGLAGGHPSWAPPPAPEPVMDVPSAFTFSTLAGALAGPTPPPDAAAGAGLRSSPGAPLPSVLEVRFCPPAPGLYQSRFLLAVQAGEAGEVVLRGRATLEEVEGRSGGMTTNTLGPGAAHALAGWGAAR